MLKITRQLGCVFQEMEPPKPSSILRKSSNILKPVRCVRFAKAVARHTKIRDKNPSLGMICPSDPHQRNPNAPKFEDQSQEETEWKGQGASEAAWKLAKNVLKIQGEIQSNKQFMSENWIYSWQWKSSRRRQQFHRQEIFAMNTDTHMSGSTVKNHIS